MELFYYFYFHAYICIGPVGLSRGIQKLSYRSLPVRFPLRRIRYNPCPGLGAANRFIDVPLLMQYILCPCVLSIIFNSPSVIVFPARGKTGRRCWLLSGYHLGPQQGPFLWIRLDRNSAGIRVYLLPPLPSIVPEGAFLLNGSPPCIMNAGITL